MILNKNSIKIVLTALFLIGCADKVTQSGPTGGGFGEFGEVPGGEAGREGGGEVGREGGGLGERGIGGESILSQPADVSRAMEELALGIDVMMLRQNDQLVREALEKAKLGIEIAKEEYDIIIGEAGFGGAEGGAPPAE